MITFIFGGEKNNKEYNTAVRMSSQVYKFDPFREGDLKKFAAAISRSCENITRRDYIADKELPTFLANDPMLISIYENKIPEVNEVWNRVKAFLLLAKDAGLEITIKSYQSTAGEELVQELAKVK